MPEVPRRARTPGGPRPPRAPRPGSTPRPRTPCSPRRSAAWTPPTCARLGPGPARRGAGRGQRASRPPRTCCSPGPSPSPSGWSRTTPRTPAAPSELGMLLRKARELLEGGGTGRRRAVGAVERHPAGRERLERAALRGGAGGRAADRDLDAVCALFDTAARAEERTGGRGALNFLEEVAAQDIAADTLTRRAARPDAVRADDRPPLQGPGVEPGRGRRRPGGPLARPAPARLAAGGRPDRPRRPGRTAHPGRAARRGAPALLRRGHPRPGPPDRDRRQGAGRRRRPAVPLPRPSCGRRAPATRTGRPRRPLAVAALVAELRATTVDPAASDALREAAAERLGRLAALTDDEGQPLVPAAHPHRWWGLYEPTRSEVPLRDRAAAVALSGSALDQLANTCSLQWFLGREVKADAPATAAQGFGNVVHVLADEVASGRTPADLAVLMERLDSVWDALAFDAPWKSRPGEAERARRPGTLPAAGTPWTARAAPRWPRSTAST